LAYSNGNSFGPVRYRIRQITSRLAVVQKETLGTSILAIRGDSRSFTSRYAGIKAVPSGIHNTVTINIGIIRAMKKLSNEASKQKECAIIISRKKADKA